MDAYVLLNFYAADSFEALVKAVTLSSHTGEILHFKGFSILSPYSFPQYSFRALGVLLRIPAYLGIVFSFPLA
jgi:hypothetical protein